jgi:hypothetical protein
MNDFSNVSDGDLIINVQEISKGMQKRQAKIDELAKELTWLNSQQAAAKALLEQCQEEQALRRYTNRTTDINWAHLFAQDPWGKNDEMRQALRELMDGKAGLEWAGISTITNSFAFKIFIYEQGVSPAYLMLLKNGIMTILPHIVAEPDGRKRIKLMEPSLSYNGSYNIYEKDGKWSIERRGWANNVDMTLDELIDYLVKHFAFRPGE